MEKTDEKNVVKDKEPSHNLTGKYAILMETSGEEYESWYYFIRVEGNEENLKFLQHQLEKIDWHILDDLSTFDLELEPYVSAQTAKEMTKVDLNPTSFHRKFDGKLQRIDFDFKKKDGNETKICKVFDVLGYGQIEDYISDEDIDEEDLETDSTDNESVSDDEDTEEEYLSKKNKHNRIPLSILIKNDKEKDREEDKKETKRDKKKETKKDK